MVEDVVEGYADARPQFWVAAEFEAQRRGVSAQKVLDEDLRRLRSEPYPGPNCLRPHEVEFYAKRGQGALPAARVAHLEECHICSTLAFVASHPLDEATEEALHEIMRNLAIKRGNVPRQ